MLLQTNSYLVPREHRTEHARLVKQFKAVMTRLGCESFNVYEQVRSFSGLEGTGRFVQVIAFRDAAHQKAHRDKEQADPTAQDLIRQFVELLDFEGQLRRGEATVTCYAGLPDLHS